MAYGSYSAGKWKQIWTNNYYAIDVEWSARTDPVANKVQYRVTRIRGRSLNKYYSAHTSSATLGIATITAQRKTYKKSINIPKGGSQIIDLTDDSREVSANSSGKVTSECNVHGYYKCNLGGSNHCPEIAWKVANITSELPTVDRSSGSLTSVSVTSKTMNSATISVTSGVATDLIQYNINGGSWVTTGLTLAAGGSGSFTVSGLSPNTYYTINVRHRRTWNQVYSSGVAVGVTTNKPAAPTKGTLSVASKTYNSITYSLSGFGFGSGATWGAYQWSTNNSSWTSIGSSTSFTRTGLSPNTSYTTYARLVDNYGSASASASVATTTNKPAAPTKGSVSVSSKTSNSITYSISGFSFGAGGTWGKYQWSGNNSTWTDIGSSTSFTRSGLSPNTSYTTYVRLVDNYGTASSSASVATTTNKPAAPTAGSVSIKSTTYNSITCSISGFSFGSGATFGNYQWSTDAASWNSIGSSTSFTINNLSPNTTYTIYVKLVDNYSTSSSTVSIEGKTALPEAGNAATINLAVSVTTSSATITISGGTPGAGASIDHYRYYWNNAWHDLASGTTSFTLTGLTAATTYNITVGFVDNFGTVATGDKTQPFITYQPGAPTVGTIIIEQLSEGKYKVTANNFTTQTPATIAYYYFTFGKYSIKTNVNEATFYPVATNTLYQVTCYVEDTFGQISNAVIESYSTFGDNPKIDLILGNMLMYVSEDESTLTVDKVMNMIDQIKR